MNRRVLLSVTALVVVAACAGAGLFAWRNFADTLASARASKGGAAGTAPSASPVHVALGPVPTQLPLTGGPGLDAFGAPLRTADRAGFHALLRSGKYEDLARYFEEMQAKSK